MAARIEAFDWASTPLGPIEAWSASLRAIAAMVLESRFPMALWWGRDLRNLHNDAYVAVLAGKHPAALGQPAAQIWADIWSIVGAQVEQVISGKGATWNEHLRLPMNRKGFLEETYFTFSYSPVRGDDGAVAGMLVTCQETTVQVQGERQLQMLSELGAGAAEATSAEAACRTAAAILERNEADLPFSLLYLRAGSGDARLVAAVGRAEGVACPDVVSLEQETTDGWPLAGARKRDELVVVDDLQERFGSGGADPSVRCAVVVPLVGASQRDPYGWLVAGLSSLRAFDERYRGLFRLTAGHVAAAIGRARAFEEQRKRAEELADIDRAKTTFFSNISHEFRTPLTLMLGPTEELLTGVHGELSTGQRAQLELVRRNELRLQRLVNALLEFSRVEAGRVQASYEPVDLAEFTRDLASGFRSLIERAGLRFTVDCPPIGEPVFVDRDQWEQIVLNLLSNAFKFTFEGEIGLSLRARETDVVLEVKDTGVGVRPEDVPRLFERFHRVEGTRARTHEGSGIGLALVQELARIHGGTISAESAHGVGTTFRVTIPRGSAHLPTEYVRRRRAPSGAGAVAAFTEEALRWLPEAEDASPESSRPNDARSSTAKERRAPSVECRVLVADDNADMREYLKRILGERWTVETVSDGAAALEAVRLRSPDLVLTDAMMPVLDGFKLLKALREDPLTQGIPVLMLSARAGEAARVEGLEAGADDYLVKPFSARELVARVASNIEAYQLRRALEAERAKLRALFEGAPAMIFAVTGPEHTFEFLNAHYAAAIGHRKVLGMRIREAFPESDGQGFFEILDDVHRTGIAYAGHEAPVAVEHPTTRTVEQRFANFVFVPSRDARGAVDGILVFGFDVTDHVVARRRVDEERRLAETEKLRAESAVRVRDEFLTIASHELRTPLTTIGLQVDGLITALRMLAAEQGRDRALARAEKLRTQSDRLEHLVSGILDVFGLDSERVVLVVADLDVVALMRSVIERLRRELRKEAIVIRVRGEVLQARADRERLEQIFSHLVTNALKFGQSKPIDVTLEPTEASVRITIRDHGIGIAEADRERIFERFQRATAAHEYAGFGLGLWIVRQLLRAMNGTVEVASNDVDGTTFTVVFPRWG